MTRRHLVEAITAGLGSASPPYVSIKGGAFTLIDSNGEELPIETKYFDCVIMDTQIPAEGGSKVQRVFWGLDARNQPKGYDEGTSAPPECFSDNGIGASVQASNPQSLNCNTCAMNRFDWVSKRDATKRTKACAVIKKIAVLPMEQVEKTQQWEPIHEAAFLLRVPVMSHDNLRIYGDKFKGQQFDITEVVTRISFVHGEVGLLDFQGAAKIDDLTDKLVEKILATKATDTLVGRGDTPVSRGDMPVSRGDTPVMQALPGTKVPAAVEQMVQRPPQAVLPPEETDTPKQTDTPKRTRTRKAPEPAATPFQAQDESIPPFLRQSSGEQQGKQPLPNHGIQQGAPSPNAELEKQLADVFGLKT